MKGMWYFIRKNGRNIKGYKRYDAAYQFFQKVCDKSDQLNDSVLLVGDDGYIFHEF